MAKYLFVAPFENGTPTFPAGMDLDFPRTETEPIGGGYVLTTAAYLPDTPAIVLLNTTPANRDTLVSNPNWVYLSEVVEETTDAT